MLLTPESPTEGRASNQARLVVRIHGQSMKSRPYSQSRPSRERPPPSTVHADDPATSNLDYVKFELAVQHRYEQIAAAGLFLLKLWTFATRRSHGATITLNLQRMCGRVWCLAHIECCEPRFMS